MSILRWLELSDHFDPAFLFQSYRPARRAAEAAPYGDVLRIRGPGEITTITTATVVL